MNGESWSDGREPHSRHDDEAELFARPGPLRMFLAEDDDDLRALMVEAFRRDGYEVIEAKDGTELVDYLQAALRFPLNMPDVIVTDVLMPGCSGLGVLRAMRRARCFTPVVVISAHEAEAAERSRELGAAAFLAKPFAVDDLRSAVANATLPGARARYSGRHWIGASGEPPSTRRVG